MTDVTPTSQAGHERKARVAKVFRDQRLYAVAYAKGVSGPITFSINPDHAVWSEETEPVVGTMVILEDIRKMDGGWRAFKARFLRPEDEDPNQ